MPPVRPLACALALGLCASAASAASFRHRAHVDVVPAHTAVDDQAVAAPEQCGPVPRELAAGPRDGRRQLSRSFAADVGEAPAVLLRCEVAIDYE